MPTSGHSEGKFFWTVLNAGAHSVLKAILQERSKAYRGISALILCLGKQVEIKEKKKNWDEFTVRIDNSTFERVEEFKYLGTALTNQNSIAEEIKSRLKSGNACYHSVQNF